MRWCCCISLFWWCAGTSHKSLVLERQFPLHSSWGSWRSGRRLGFGGSSGPGHTHIWRSRPGHVGMARPCCTGQGTS